MKRTTLRRYVEAVADWMQPGAPSGQGRARIRHRATVHVSETDELRLWRDPPAPDAPPKRRAFKVG